MSDVDNAHQRRFWTFNRRMAAVTLGVTLILTTMSLAGSEPMGTALANVGMLIYLVGLLIATVGMMVNHTSNCIENAIPNVYGVGLALCFYLGVSPF